MASRRSATIDPETTYTAEQLQPLLEALQAAQAGDFSVRLPTPRNGVLSEISRAFNDVIGLNEKMAKEIVRVGRIVGREGRMTERAALKGASGSWAVSIDSINTLIEDLARPTTEVRRVITAVAEGDLNQKMALEIQGTPVKGEFLSIGTTVNTMVDQLSSFASEVTRVAREVGTEGILGGQAEVKGVSGTWKDLTDSVNSLASNLTGQVRNIAEVTTAVANGDLSKKITVDVRGEILDLKDTINTMVDQLNAFASEVTRVAREVGTEGILGGQAEVRGVSGTWKDLTDSVNSMASNLTGQVRNIAEVTTAVANGDLSKKITVDVRGEILDLKDTINTMVDQLGAFASEVTRVAREVGTEGILGGQAEVQGVSGTWKDLTDSVNFMASNLTGQVRNIAEVTTAVAMGDLSKKITVDVRGEILDLKDTINVMVDQLNAFASEVTRVAREVGTEGILGGQAEVQGVSGTWKDLTDSVNSMASNLTGQVRNIAEVTTAVANGDLSKKITVDVKGEILDLKDTINTMVDQLNAFASEVTRVAREVGTEGILGGQAEVKGVAGTWKDLTDNVNSMASNLTGQVRNIAEVTTAVANGDLSKKITVDVRGEILDLKNTINTMVDQLGAFASEVTRVAREVGTEGILGGQADVKGVSGTWKDLTDSVNFMASNLTGQVRNIAEVTTAVANGDLSKKITVDVRGEILDLKDTINTMVDQLNAFASEVTRVAREVGTEGILGGQAEVRGVSGTWKDLTDSVNFMASNLTGQVRNIAEVTTAVAMGDLSKKITVDVRGEILDLKDTINVMVDQLNAFASEVTRVAREVGTEGRLGGQAEVRGVSGTWKDLTDSVNSMASNLTGQVRNIAEVTTAVANGDLSKKITVDVRGEILDLKNTINVMVDQLGAFASEVTRVAREVGTEGILGGQADVRGVSGTWKDLTDSVNFMASNLTGQVRNIAEVTTAVAMGDLSKKITVDVRGEILDLKDTINVMVDQLNAFASEVTRVAREVGTEGRLGGQAEVQGVSGTWKDLTDSVNSMASNLTGQVRNIAEVTTAVANGDLSKKITVDVRGEILDLKNTINTMVDQLNAFASEVTRVAREVGTEGILGGQARVPNVAGTWKDLTDNVNIMASNLTAQVRNIAEVTTAVANGDLSKKITVNVKGEILDLKKTINTMVDQLNAFASEVTRVAREVGTEGILGGQANVKGVSGTWKDLTDNVNIMAGNLTAQVRNIAEVVTAVANGDLKKKLVVEAKGEIAKLADTINNMTDTLSIFAQQVTTVAREVGTEGKLGGQAKVPNVAGTWKDLTDSVNSMANSLTVQVRAIADVATAVTEGDLTSTITVEAQGEVSALKDNLNQMIANLKETTLRNEQQDWLKTNLASFSRMMQGQKSLESVAQLIMSELTPKVTAHHGVFYINDPLPDGEPLLKLISSYGYKERKNVANIFRLGESLVGQCALEKKLILLTNVPSDYIKISSGLGESTPLNIIVLPVLFEGEIMAVVELASFLPFSDIHVDLLEQLMESIGVVLNMIAANTRREELYEESQSLTQELTKQSEELQAQQEQLKTTNTALEKQAKELEEKATLLAEQNQQVEQKNREVELARAALQEKSDQLALRSDQLAQRSKYKSEFLANMSHELRTPLNSMLILAKLLADNEEGNLTQKQTKFASTIHSSGNDLLNLINEILDLSKVEAGKMDVDIAPVAIDDIHDYVERTFREIAIDKALTFNIAVASDVPAVVNTDMQRLQQVLRNLLSNAFKFTEHGEVRLDIRLATPADNLRGRLPYQSRDNRIIAFEVSDSGIGIPREKQELIFAAFQQADGTTSRKYGGTGLGLSISRGITTLLGGTIGVNSAAGKGSKFTLYLPEYYNGPAPAPSEDGYSYDSHAYNGNSDGNGYGGNGYSSDGTSASVGGYTTSPALSNGPVMETRAALPPASVITSPQHTLDSPTPTTPVADGITGQGVIEAKGATPPSPSAATMSSLSSAASAASALSGQRARARHELNDDRETVQPGDQVLLIVEDDVNFARILLEMARKRGFKVLVALDGETGLAMAQEYRPDAITLDLQLPLVDGWTVLDHLKRDPQTRHIPIQVISVLDRQQGSMVGAIAYLEKPVSSDALEGALAHIKSFVDRDVKDLLVVEDNEVQRQSIIEVIGNQDVVVTAVATGEQALTQLKEKRFDCVVLDLGLPDMEGFELLKKIKRQTKYKDLPVVIYTSKDLSKREEVQLKKYAATIITKDATSSERLLDETALFLHRVIGKMPAAKRRIVEQRHRDESTASPATNQVVTAPSTPPVNKEPSKANAPVSSASEGQSTTAPAREGGASQQNGLSGKKVLVVDDDMRNIFALTSVLENYGMEVVFAENGRDALNVLNITSDIDVILMDVMMPEMDGYETTRAVRQMDHFANLPIISLTAKAMEGDRAKCLEAGASDYIPKPVDIDQLLAMLRQWLNVENAPESSS